MTTHITPRTRRLSDAWSVHTMGEERPSNLGLGADCIFSALTVIDKARTALKARNVWRLRLTKAPGARSLLRSLDEAEESLVPYTDRMIGGLDVARKLGPWCHHLIKEVKARLEDRDHFASNSYIERELERALNEIKAVLDAEEPLARAAKTQAAAAAAAERQAAKAALAVNANLPDWEPRDLESASIASDVWSVASKADARSNHEEFGDLIKVVQRTQLRVDEFFPSRFHFLAPSAVKDFRRALSGAKGLFLKYRYRKISVAFLHEDLVRICQSLETYLKNGLKEQDPRRNKPYEKLAQKVDDTVVELKAVLMEAKVDTLKRREISGRLPIL